MDTYLRSPNFIIYDYKTNFNSIEFQSFLRSIEIIPKLILIKVYYLINKIKRYYYFFYYTYEIVYKEYPNLYNDYKF